eukprot:Skav208098  [mRNA]  locus=scaffold1681:178343:180999:- [translate_table: standard]
MPEQLDGVRNPDMARGRTQGPRDATDSGRSNSLRVLLVPLRDDQATGPERCFGSPLITRCSHIFCSCCFRQWVQTEVDRHKSENKTAGTQPVAVPQIRCPQPGCDQFLKKTDVEPADDGKTSGVQLFQRLRNNLNIRCVHHIDHHKLEFGQDASRILLEKGRSW